MNSATPPWSGLSRPDVVERAPATRPTFDDKNVGHRQAGDGHRRHPLGAAPATTPSPQPTGLSQHHTQEPDDLGRRRPRQGVRRQQRPPRELRRRLPAGVDLARRGRRIGTGYAATFDEQNVGTGRPVTVTGVALSCGRRQLHRLPADPAERRHHGPHQSPPAFTSSRQGDRRRPPRPHESPAARSSSTTRRCSSSGVIRSEAIVQPVRRAPVGGLRRGAAARRRRPVPKPAPLHPNDDGSTTTSASFHAHHHRIISSNQRIRRLHQSQTFITSVTHSFHHRPGHPFPTSINKPNHTPSSHDHRLHRHTRQQGLRHKVPDSPADRSYQRRDPPTESSTLHTELQDREIYVTS